MYVSLSLSLSLSFCLSFSLSGRALLTGTMYLATVLGPEEFADVSGHNAWPSNRLQKHQHPTLRAQGPPIGGLRRTSVFVTYS